MRTLSAYCAQAAPTTPCRGAYWAVSWLPYDRVVGMSCCVAARTRALARRVAASGLTVSQPPPSQHQILCHDTTLSAHDLRVLRAVSRAHSAVSQGAVALCRNTRPSPPAARPACRPAVSQGLLAVSWPPAARPNPLCHNTIHCIVTQTGKWAIAHSSSYLFYNFFFTHFFFHFVPPTARPQKKKKFFHVSSRTK